MLVDYRLQSSFANIQSILHSKWMRQNMNAELKNVKLVIEQNIEMMWDNKKVLNEYKPSEPIVPIIIQWSNFISHNSDTIKSKLWDKKLQLPFLSFFGGGGDAKTFLRILSLHLGIQIFFFFFQLPHIWLFFHNSCNTIAGGEIWIVQ